MARKRAAARDIQIPAIKNPARRRRCSGSLLLFEKTYFPHLAYLKIAPFQEERLAQMETMIRYGGRQAKAEPRGSAKTTHALIAALWALLYGYRRHFMVVRASDPEAEQIIRDAKLELETNELLLEDFPEVCAPIRALEGAPQRAGQQTYKGVRTRCEYHSGWIVLPRAMGKSQKSAGSVLSTSGITGKIRGRKINQLRPDFVLLDDIEDNESVKSEAVTAKYDEIIRSDVGGLGGPGKSVAILWLGTIIRRMCLIDQATDRQMRPEWQGKRQAALIEWPTDQAMALWEIYWEMMSEGRRKGDDPTGRRACEFYRDNRAAMDAGAVVAWADNYIRESAEDGSPLEISNLQHLMNKRLDMGEDAFLTEYQNDPPEPGQKGELNADLVASRLSLYPAGVVPAGYEFRLVQGIDIRGREIHYIVDAVKEDGSTATIDYDILPVDAPDGDLGNPRDASRPALERAVLTALRRRREVVQARPYRDHEGNAVEIALTLVDSGWLPDVVYLFVRESGPRWRASKGDQQVPGNARFRMPAKGSGGTVIGEGWYAKLQASGNWLYHLDADKWKLAAQERYLQSPDTAGSAVWFGNDAKAHRLIAKHIVAERWNLEKSKFEQLSKFNHFLDCKAMCLAAAGMVGAGLMRQEQQAARTPLATFRRRIKSSWLRGS